MKAARWLVSLGVSLVVCAISPVFAQGFDFGGEEGGGEDTGGEEMGEGFDFGNTGSTAGQGAIEKAAAKIEMPDGSKPIIAAFFHPVDETEAEELIIKGEDLTAHFQEIEKYDAVHGLKLYLAILAKGPDDAEACLYDPSCLAEEGQALGVDYVVIGRFYGDDPDNVTMSLDLVRVEDSFTDILGPFEVSSFYRKQREQMRPAAYRIMDEKLPGIEDIVIAKPKEESWFPPLPEWQMWAAIGTGGAALALFATGIVFGADASGLESDIDVGFRNATKTQREIRDMIQEAETSALVANIMFGAGTLALVGTAIFLLVRPDEEVLESTGDVGIQFHIAPQLSPSGVGLTGGVRF